MKDLFPQEYPNIRWGSKVLYLLRVSVVRNKSEIPIIHRYQQVTAVSILAYDKEPNTRKIEWNRCSKKGIEILCPVCFTIL